MPHLPQPARAHGRAMTSSARRAKRRTPPAEPVGEIEDIAVAASTAPEAAPAMQASDASGEN